MKHQIGFFDYIDDFLSAAREGRVVEASLDKRDEADPVLVQTQYAFPDAKVMTAVIGFLNLHAYQDMSEAYDPENPLIGVASSATNIMMPYYDSARFGEDEIEALFLAVEDTKAFIQSFFSPTGQIIIGSCGVNGVIGPLTEDEENRVYSTLTMLTAFTHGLHTEAFDKVYASLLPNGAEVEGGYMMYIHHGVLSSLLQNESRFSIPPLPEGLIETLQRLMPE